MKKAILAILPLMLAVTLSAQQSRRIYITLDVSGSMGGDKYSLANYTTQMLVSLAGEEDEVHMIVYGKDAVLSREADPLKIIQKPRMDLRFGKPESLVSQFEDIIGFNAIYRPSGNKQDWLFVVGDGFWLTSKASYKEDREKFTAFVKGGTLNVCYLQTGGTKDEHNDFTQFADSLGVIDIGKSSMQPQSIKDGCDHFARKILGFSDAPLKTSHPDARRIRISSELPLTAFYLVCQDEVKPEALPGIQSASVDGKVLGVTLKGTPTTIPTKDQAASVDLSGNVWLLQADGIIPAQSPVEVVFDKDINPSNVRIYPLVKNVEFGSVGLSSIGGKLKQLDSKSFVICREESKARVRIELSDESKDMLPENLLEKTRVVVKADGREYPARFINGGFECTIDLTKEETQYYAECEYPGYFKRVTPITTIVKGDCPEEPKSELEEKVMTIFRLRDHTFRELKEQPIALTIHDAESMDRLDPRQFDIVLEVENDFLYENPTVRIDNSVIFLELQPKGKWCECLFPDSLRIRMVSTPKDSALDEYGKNYQKNVFPIHFKVQKERSWLSRCLWVIVTIIALFLLFFYLKALLSKRRFKKNAQIVPVYYNRYGEEINDGAGQRLRKPGFLAWAARWFWPGTEKSLLTFTNPACNLTFYASDSKEMVEIPKDGITPEMEVEGYDPNNDPVPSQPARLGPCGQVVVNKPNGRRDGYLSFMPCNENDWGGLRIFLILVMILSLLGAIGLIFLMVKSFL